MISVSRANYTFRRARCQVLKAQQNTAANPSLLLGRASRASTTAASGLRVLPAHPDAPVVAQASMQPDLLHPLQVLAQGLVKEVCVLLASLAILHITLPI